MEYSPLLLLLLLPRKHSHLTETFIRAGNYYDYYHRHRGGYGGVVVVSVIIAVVEAAICTQHNGWWRQLKRGPHAASLPSTIYRHIIFGYHHNHMLQGHKIPL